jgi:hypothetical protein
MRTKIRKRPNGRWYVFLVNDTGEHSHGGYATKREATRVAAGLLTDAERGHYTPPGKLTVADYLVGEWLPSRETADVSANTGTSSG